MNKPHILSSMLLLSKSWLVKCADIAVFVLSGVIRLGEQTDEVMEITEVNRFATSD